MLPIRLLPLLQAIDLIDEATARVKMEKTLKPEVLDKMERRIRDLESERRCLQPSGIESIVGPSVDSNSSPPRCSLS